MIQVQKKQKSIYLNTNRIVLKATRKLILLLNLISYELCVWAVTQLYYMPKRRFLSSRQRKFYNKGHNSVFHIKDYHIHLLEKGVGPRVLLIHGWESSAYEMRHVAQTLIDKGFTVVMPDLPCHGRSSGRFINQIEMSYIIQELLLLLNQRSEIEYIVSHSWGGVVTQLALDRLFDQDRVKLKKMVALSLPTKPSAFIERFCLRLKLPARVAKGFKMNLERNAYCDQRMLNEAFPLGLQKLYKKLPFELNIIHDQDDETVAVSNIFELAQKYSWAPINISITSNLGHFGILEDPSTAKEVASTLIRECVVA